MYCSQLYPASLHASFRNRFLCVSSTPTLAGPSHTCGSQTFENQPLHCQDFYFVLCFRCETYTGSKSECPDVHRQSPNSRCLAWLRGRQIERVDWWLGKFMAYLRSSGQIDSTIVCLASDHGEMLGDRAATVLLA